MEIAMETNQFPEASTPNNIPSKEAELAQVTIKKENGTFGFVIIGGQGSEHIPGYGYFFVSSIRDDTPASRCDSIQVGDRIVSVNGIELDGMTHTEAVDIFKNADQITMVIEPQSEHRILNEVHPIPFPTMPSPIRTIASAAGSLISNYMDSTQIQDDLEDGDMDELRSNQGSSIGTPSVTSTPTDRSEDDNKPLYSEDLVLSLGFALLVSTVYLIYRFHK